MATLLVAAALGLILPASAMAEEPGPCLAGNQGLRMTLRDRDGSDHTYGYFRLRGDNWVVARYPRDQDRPDHIWFGTSAPGNPALVRVVRDEPFDTTEHHDPCSGWLGR